MSWSRDRLIGVGTAAGAAIAVILSLWLMWDALARWRSTSLTREAQLAAWNGRAAQARNLARDALGWQRLPAAELLAIDRASPDAARQLTALAEQAMPGDREAIADLAALAGAPSDRTAGDWLKAAERWNAGEMVPEPMSTPGMAVWQRAAAARLAGAQRRPDAEPLRLALGMAYAAFPRHGERMLWRAVMLGLAAPRDVVESAFAPLDATSRDRATRWLRLLRPEIVAPEVVVLPGAAGMTLPATPGERLRLLRETALRQRADLPVLIARLPDTEQPRARLLAAEVAGDAKAAVDLLIGLGAQIIPVSKTADSATFDLVLADGSAPMLSFTIRVNGVDASPQRITRLAHRYIVAVGT